MLPPRFQPRRGGGGRRGIPEVQSSTLKKLIEPRGLPTNPPSWREGRGADELCVVEGDLLLNGPSGRGVVGLQGLRGKGKGYAFACAQLGNKTNLV